MFQSGKVENMKRKLTKSKTNVVLTGTLAGIADYIKVDPTIVRILFVFISLMGMGSPILLYILLAIIIPSPKKAQQFYGHDNPYYRGNQAQGNKKTTSRKEAEKVDEDDWSDF